MKTISTFCISIFFFFSNVNSCLAQKATEAFKFENILTVAPSAYFSDFNLIDGRDDTSSIGIIQKGVLNKKVSLVCEPSLNEQLQTIFKQLTKDNNSNTELILLLQHLNFSEATYSTKEIGILQIRGVFFAKKDNKYSKLLEIDTLQTVQNLDVTKQLLKKGNAFFIDLFNAALNTLPQTFDLDNLSYLINYDSLQKAKLPLYAAKDYKAGAYATYEELVNQTPSDTTIKIEFYKSGHWKSVQHKNKAGKYEEVVLKDWYAYVFENKIFPSTSIHEVYPVEKKGNDFYFKGKIWTPASTAQSVTMSVAFGLLGALAASAGNTETTQLKIDYKTGAFIRAWQKNKRQ
jgi:hypothetical protein